jgi:hypothetical protein
LVFEVITTQGINIETSILSGEILIWENEFAFIDPTINFYSFETSYDLIDISFKVDLTIEEVSLDLNNYYNFLII